MDKKVIIIPTYNEKENIEKIIRKVFSLPQEFHILVIDDGSPDGTADIVKRLQKEFAGNLHILERKGKLGLGTAYIKDIRSPINHVPLMATGGISVDNFADFLKVGCCSAGIGSYLSDKKLIAAGDWAELRSRAERFINIFREANK